VNWRKPRTIMITNPIHVGESCQRRNADSIRKGFQKTGLKTPKQSCWKNRSSSFGPIHERLVFANRKQECVTMAKEGSSKCLGLCLFNLFIVVSVVVAG
jgi:hypothetical protein